MNYRRFLIGTVYGIVLCGWGAIWIGDRIDPVLMLGVFLAIVFGAYGDVTGKHLLRPTWNRMLLLVGIGLAIADWRYGSRVWFLSIVLLMLYVGAVRALSPKANRDLQQMIGLGFLQLLAASVLTVDLAYAFFFLAFFVLVPWALLAVAIKAELEGERDMLRGAVAAPGRLETPFGADRMLTRGALISMLLALGMTMVVTVAFFTAFPRLSTGMISGRLGLGANVSGFSERVRLGGSGSILQDSSPAARLVMLRGSADPESLYLRGIALDNYDGSQWTYSQRGKREQTHHGQLYFGAEGDRRAYPEMRIILEDLGTNLLLLPQRPLRIESPIPKYEIDDGLMVVRVPKFQGGFRYDVRYDPTTYWQATDWAALPAQVEAGVAAAWRQLTEVPNRDDLPLEILRYADRQNLAWVPEAMAELATFQYSLDLPDSADPLRDFFARRAGHCEMFATSLALMLRAAGVPALVVNGFRGAEPIDDYMLVRQRNAHTWVEVYHPAFGGAGIPLDPTPPLPPVATFWQRSQEAWQRVADRVWFFWMDKVVSYDLATQETMVDGARDSARELGATFRAQRDAFRRWLQAAGLGAIWLAGGVLAVVGLWLTWLLWQRRAGDVQRGAWRRAPGWLNRLVREIEKQYGKRPLHLPVVAWAKNLPLEADELDFFSRYDVWRYSATGDPALLRRDARHLLKRRKTRE